MSVFVVSISGAMAPGPVTATAITLGTKEKYAGVYISIGHAVVEVPLVVISRDVAQEDGPAWTDLGVVEEKAGQPEADVLERGVGLVCNSVAELSAAGDHLAMGIEHLRLQNVDLHLLEETAVIAQVIHFDCSTGRTPRISRVDLGTVEPETSLRARVSTIADVDKQIHDFLLNRNTPP